MSALDNNSGKTISQLFENITNDMYEKHKTNWDKSKWSYFCKLSKQDKLESIKLFIYRLCCLSNIKVTIRQNIFQIHKKSFKIYVSVSPNKRGLYQLNEHYILGQSPWKTDYLMFINVRHNKIYMTIIKNFTENYYRITSSNFNFVHSDDTPIDSIQWNKFTKDFSIIIKKSNLNHSFVIDSTKTDCDVELFIQFIHKQIPIGGAFSKTDISYNEQQLKAIANYETFYGLESGSSNIIDVIESSAGIDGWSNS